MIDGKFDVVFRGQIIRSMDESLVKSNLVGLFKSSPEAVEKLFGGNEVVVRKSLDYATAMKYQSALKKAGALALIKEIEIDNPVEKSPSAAGKATFGSSDETQATSVQGMAQSDAISSTEQQHSKPIANPIPEVKSPVAKDLSADSQPVGEDSAFSLAAAGERLLPDKIYEKREVDTSELSLASVGERILPKSIPESHPQPSIDHLKLED